MKTRITMTDDRNYEGVWSIELWADTEVNFDFIANRISDIADACGCPDDSDGYTDTLTASETCGCITKGEWIKEIRKAIKREKAAI